MVRYGAAVQSHKNHNTSDMIVSIQCCAHEEATFRGYVEIQQHLVDQHAEVAAFDGIQSNDLMTFATKDLTAPKHY